MNLLVAALVRNEADRYLHAALDAWQSFADEVLILDDNSTDDTAEVCDAAGCTVSCRGSTTNMWGAETPARRELWDLAYQAAVKRGLEWIMVLDADMIPAKDPRDLLVPGVQAISSPLYDLWRQSENGDYWYREDRLWHGHKTSRVWIVRTPPKPEAWAWPERGLHVGHFPLNLNYHPMLVAPQDYGLLHYAYIQPEDRQSKLVQYLSIRDALSNQEVRHAESICDPNPYLRMLPFEPQWKLQKPESSLVALSG